MASPSFHHDLTLLGIPKELLLKILMHLFEDFYPLRGWYTDRMFEADLEIFRTCHLLYVEGKKALRARFRETRMEYDINGPPKMQVMPERDTTEADAGGNMAHISFLQQYGDCFETVSLFAEKSEDECKFSMHWFPNLKKLELQGEAYWMYAEKDEGLFIDGDLDKEAVLRKFKTLYEDYEAMTFYESTFDPDVVEAIKSKKGVDRDYTVVVHMRLEIEDVGTWDIAIIDEEEVEYESTKDYTKSNTAVNSGACDGTEIKDIVAFQDVDMEEDEGGNE